MADRVHTAHVLTVLNLKGGVGKTHPSWVLASVAQERGQRILLVDLETLGNLSKSFLKYVAFDESMALVQRTTFSHVDPRDRGAGIV